MASEKPPPEPSDEQQAEQALRDLFAAWEAGDCDTMMSYFYFEPGEEDFEYYREVCEEEGYRPTGTTVGSATKTTLLFDPKGTDAVLDVPYTTTINGETDSDFFFMVRVDGKWMNFPN